MTLEDFERQLAEQQKAELKREKREKESSGNQEKRHGRHHRHHEHGGPKERDRSSERRHDEHRSKRRRHGEDREHKHHHKGHQRRSSTERKGPDTNTDATTTSDHYELKRDSWMETPSALEVDYVQSKRQKIAQPQSRSLGADHELKLHKNELNHHLRDLSEGDVADDLKSEPETHKVAYTFGDAGSQWRMTKLRAVYRQAKETDRSLDAVALERYGSLQDFDDAREEEIELGRRETYGDGYLGKDQPSGELYQERQEKSDAIKATQQAADQVPVRKQIMEGVVAPVINQPSSGQRVDQTTLNKMKAGLMKARLRKDPNLKQLETEYEQAAASFQSSDPAIVTLSAMDNRMLSSAPRNEVRAVANRRGAERGNVEENEDMSIEDMVREERRTRHEMGGEAKRFAERIAKDGKFDNNLEYMDENATKLAKRVHKSDINLRNVAITEYQKTARILERCPLCHHEDTETPPVAPVVSLATRTYLTLPTEPELASYAAMITPIEHRTNLLECDDDEWEEIRNFMKSLTRLYHDQGRDVIFYENAAHPQRKPHAALNAIPLPYSLGETAPAFFKEAFLTTEDEWSQHKKIIDTLAQSRQGMGKSAFRRTLVKEMPYFHVWFELDGGIGHVVEDAGRWPKGDLFAREIIGGMLDLEPDVIKRQGRWQRGHDSRTERFRKQWHKFDWTRVLQS